MVFVKDPQSKALINLGHTSVIRDTPNPDWPDQLAIDYRFEEVQEIVIKLYDQDDKKSPTDFASHDFIGEVTFTLADLMCSRDHRFSGQIKGGHNMGTVHVRGEAIHNTRDIFVVNFVGAKLAAKNGFFGKSDPFLIISRCYEDGSYVVCWRGDHVTNTLNPAWTTSRIPLVALCNGDIDRPIRIQLMDYESSGKHQPMGVVDTSVRALMNSAGAPMNVIEADKKAKSKSYVNSGTLSAQRCVIEKHPSMTDFIMGGCEVSLMVAIDFTGSNGDPRDPSSLHFVNKSGNPLNQYEHAISALGRVVEPYDTDKLFPVFGFGAKVHLPNGTFSTVQHCFPVYGGGNEVLGVDGIMQAYHDCLGNVALSGPTLFSPLIETCAGIAAAAAVSQERQKYFVLLIITDGAINDLDQSIASVVRASGLPLSIIICGVGTADFSSMVALDGDGGMLRSGPSTASRDIVQFVPFREFLAKGPVALAQETLKEVPGQFLQYMKQRSIVPNAASLPPPYEG